MARQRLAVVAARQIVLETGIRGQAIVAHQLAPAHEQRLSDGHGVDPAVPALEAVGRAGREAAVECGDAVEVERRLLDQVGVGDVDGGTQQRRLDLLALAAPSAVYQGCQHAHGVQERRTEIDERGVGAGRHLTVAGQVHGARHCLANRVEAHTRGVGAVRTEGRSGGEDDARIDG